MAILRQIIRHAIREKNVPGIATIHHSLRHVDARASYVRALVHITKPIHWSAVNPDSELNFGIGLISFAQFNRTSHRRVRRGKEGERHPIPGWDRNQFSSSVSLAELLRRANKSVQFLNQGMLLIDQAF